MVSCDVTSGNNSRDSLLKMPVFTLYLPHNLQSRVLVISEVYILGIRFQVKLTKISLTKGWSDQEVNTQFDKDLNP